VAYAEEILMNINIKLSQASTLFMLLPFLEMCGNYPKFLAIPALNNPRAGFARCKENNHV
jgi:hypothetical protein